MSTYYKLTKEDGSELTAQEAYDAAMQGPCYVVERFVNESSMVLSVLAEKSPVSKLSTDGEMYAAAPLFMMFFCKDGDTVTGVMFYTPNNSSAYWYAGINLFE